MNLVNKKAILAGVAALMIWAAALPTAFAQDASKGTVVIYPVVFNRNSGSKTARETAIRSMEEILQKHGYTLISSTVAQHEWDQLGFKTPMTEKPARRADIVQFGTALNAQFVVQPVFDFDSRSIWVGLGPKTISTATVDVIITDVAQNNVAYEKHGVIGRSDERDSLLKGFGDLVITPLITVVSGGPKTPHEQRAVQIAVIRAMRDFVHHDP